MSLNRQHRDESDFLTDELFDIKYNDSPLVEYVLGEMDRAELENINHVEFATDKVIGNWNLLSRNRLTRCYDGLCKNGGQCRDGFNRYTCICGPGFEGDHCEWDFNDCNNVSCYTQDALIAPECKDGDDTFFCGCKNNWSGKLCDNPPHKGVVKNLPADVLDRYDNPGDHVQNLTLFIPEIYGIRNTGILILFETMEVICATDRLEFLPITTLDNTPVEDLKTYSAKDDTMKMDREIEVYGENVCKGTNSNNNSNQPIAAIFFENVRSLQVTFTSSVRIEWRSIKFKFQVFHMEETKCKCDNGKPVEDAKCRGEGTQNCSECDKFYRLSSNTDTASFWYNTALSEWAETQICVPNECKCDRGYPSRLCPAHDMSNCEACHSTGDTLNDEKLCIPNKCKCEYGIKDEGHECEDNGFEDCSACNDFFHDEIVINDLSRWYGTTSHHLANKQICRQNVCVCENGEPIAESICSIHG